MAQPASAGSLTAAQIVTALLDHPYPHELIAIRQEVEREGKGEEIARKEMAAYCTHQEMIEARQKWNAAQDAARKWLGARKKGKANANRCQRPDLCMLTETCMPCEICPNAKKQSEDRQSAADRCAFFILRAPSELPEFDGEILVALWGAHEWEIVNVSRNINGIFTAEYKGSGKPASPCEWQWWADLRNAGAVAPPPKMPDSKRDVPGG